MRTFRRSIIYYQGEFRKYSLISSPALRLPLRHRACLVICELSASPLGSDSPLHPSVSSRSLMWRTLHLIWWGWGGGGRWCHACVDASTGTLSANDLVWQHHREQRLPLTMWEKPQCWWGGVSFTRLLISPGYHSCKLYILTGPSLSLVCVHLNHSQTLSLPNILHQTWSYPLHQLQLLNRKMSTSTFSASEADRTQCWPNVPLILARCYSDVCPMFLWRLTNVFYLPPTCQLLTVLNGARGYVICSSTQAQWDVNQQSIQPCCVGW